MAKTKSRKTSGRTKPPPPEPIGIPREVIEYVLYGKRAGVGSRLFPKGGGVVAEVWYAFAKDPAAKVRVLIAPASGVSTLDLAKLLNSILMSWRQIGSDDDVAQDALPGITPLDSFIAATVYFEELVTLLLPLTQWWKDAGVGVLAGKPAGDGQGPSVQEALAKQLPDFICQELAVLEGNPPRAASKQGFSRSFLEAAPMLVVTGLLRAAIEKRPLGLPKAADVDQAISDAAIAKWFARPEVTQLIVPLAQFSAPKELLAPLTDHVAQRGESRQRNDGLSPLPYALIQRIFRDRNAEMSIADASKTVKADACVRLFNITCDKIAWAVIDSGVDVGHPGFEDRARRPASGQQANPGGAAPETPRPGPSRFDGIYDFSIAHLILSLDIMHPVGLKAAADAVRERHEQPTPGEKPEETLKAIADCYERDTKPDWKLVERLITIAPERAKPPVSAHGTHVAGIIGADWDENARGSGPLRGMCPDIRLYDFRILSEKTPEGGEALGAATESSLIAALDFIQYLNTRNAQAGLQIHGVNISLAIRHEVRNYGCGSTPVCVAADKLVNSGVVVVAAAGNYGWNETKPGYDQFLTSTITDPGNARNVITVGSTHKSRPHAYGVSYFSSRGPTGDGRMKPDIVAPGERILSLIPGESADEMTGTSMASPVVSGAAAMLLARYRELIGNPQRVKDILCRSATDLDRVKHFQGHGLVDVLRALQSV